MVPELQDVKKKDIHEWSTKYLEYQDFSVKYCKPIVNIKYKKSVEMYREVLSKKIEYTCDIKEILYK